MPTYDYCCKSCNHRFEAFQSMKDKALKKCPECGKQTLERLIGTGAAILFKGSGFYQTDYRSESYKKGAASESKPSDAGSKDSPAKTDSKPQAPAKTEAKSPAPESSTKSTAKKE